MYVAIHLQPFSSYSMIFYRTKHDDMGNEGGFKSVGFYATGYSIIANSNINSPATAVLAYCVSLLCA